MSGTIGLKTFLVLVGRYTGMLLFQSACFHSMIDSVTTLLLIKPYRIAILRGVKSLFGYKTRTYVAQNPSTNFSTNSSAI